jgi:hypothetical protein
MSDGKCQFVLPRWMNGFGSPLDHLIITQPAVPLVNDIWLCITHSGLPLLSCKATFQHPKRLS